MYTFTVRTEGYTTLLRVVPGPSDGHYIYVTVMKEDRPDVIVRNDRGFISNNHVDEWMETIFEYNAAQ